MPIGRLVTKEEEDARSERAADVIAPTEERKKDGSIIVVIATDVSTYETLIRVMLIVRLHYTQYSLSVLQPVRSSIHQS